MNYNKLAEQLDQAAMNAKATTQLSTFHPVNLDEAYAIQAISMGRRFIRGEKMMGMKLGFTSRAKMEQMGVHDMIWGILTSEMFYAEGGEMKMEKFIHPRAEPEIAFQIEKDIDVAIDLEDAKEYVSGVAVAIEVIDSRYENFKFSLEDVVADNCSSSGYVIGDWKPTATNIQDIAMALKIDGKVIHEGNSNAILGNPWESFVNAARLAKENGVVLKAGQIILAGAATAASYLASGQKVEAEAEGLGSVSLNVH